MICLNTVQMWAEITQQLECTAQGNVWAGKTLLFLYSDYKADPVVLWKDRVQ